MTDFSISKLRQVTTIVSHANCADGTASALILSSVLPDAEVMFAQYDSPALLQMTARPGVLFCDMTPHRSRVQDFVDAGACVLDHHPSARHIVDAFGVNGVYADNKSVDGAGVSGATLAYRKVWLPLQTQVPLAEIMSPEASRQRALVENVATLAGIYDTWQEESPRWRDARAQAAAMRFFTYDELRKLSWEALTYRLTIGAVIVERDEAHDTQSIAQAHRFTVGAVRVICFDGSSVNDIPDRVGDEVDLVLGWHYRVDAGVQKFKVSCRARGSFPVQAFAEHFGGGGHPKSAGFTVNAGDKNPYDTLQSLVEQYLSKKES